MGFCVRRSRVVFLAILALAFAACATHEPEATARLEALIVPGDWVPPDATLAISNPQYVDVVDPPSVLPLGHCDSSCPNDIWGGLCTHPACTRAHPGTAALDAYIRGQWTYVRAGGTYTCRRNSNPASCDSLSVHSIGRAIDLMITEIGGDADNSAGDPIANWLIEHAEYIGIQRVIWDGRYWNGSRRGAHFSDISDRLCGGSYCTDHHTNHIHVELSVDGAAQRTAFFTAGPPPTTCPVVCYGTAAVAADCSYVDCAASGGVCLTDPVRCGSGAPPEPSEAALHAEVVLPAVTALGGPTRFTALTPTRLFDTRTPEASTALVRSDGASSGPLGPGRSGSLPVFPGAPAGTSAVWLGLAAVPLTSAGFLVAEPAGVSAPISTVNYTPPRVRANAASVALGTGGAVAFVASADVEVVADLFGAFASTGWGLRTAGPERVLDTRALAAPLVAGEPYAVDVRAPADARGVVVSAAAIQGGVDAGFVAAFPCGAATPSTSNINFVGSSVTANTVISALGSDGRLCFVSSVGVDLVVDVTGYLVEQGELSFQPLSPVRVLDTRDPGARWTGRLGEGQTIELPIQAAPGMPADVRAAVVSLATISPGTRGYVTAYPCGIDVPRTSSLNFDADDPIAAVSVSATGAGSLCLFSNARTHLVVDLLGVWVPTPGAPPPTEGPGPTPDEPDDMMPPDTMTDDAGAGADAASPDDGGTRSDAARASAPPSGGCGCRVGEGARSSAGLPMLVLGLALVVRRSRAARGRRALTSSSAVPCSSRSRAAR